MASSRHVRPAVDEETTHCDDRYCPPHMAPRKKTGVARSQATERRPDHVTKFYNSVEKAEAAATEYGLMAKIDSDHFRSPVVRSVQNDPPAIVFELPDAKHTIDRALIALLRAGDQVTALELVATAGRALAAIHDGLKLPTQSKRSRAPALRVQLPSDGLQQFRRVPPVTLHGDFGVSNVAVDSRGGIVTYDPEPSRYTANAIDAVDTPEMDLTTFVTCLAGRTSGIRNVIALRRRYPELAACFLSAYADARDVDAREAYDDERLMLLITAQGSAYREVASARSGRAVEMTAR
jgi:hypothetical protein